MEKISAVYQIINTITGDKYVGSSKNVKNRWWAHRSPSRWKQNPNNPMYKDFQKYGIDKFRFQILAPVEPEYLTQVEQEFIEMLKPKYNSMNAKDWDVERIKETNRKAIRKFRQSDKAKEHRKKYDNQPCSYNGETLTLNTLSVRFRKAGIEHPYLEAKKYLLS